MNLNWRPLPDHHIDMGISVLAEDFRGCSQATQNQSRTRFCVDVLVVLIDATLVTLESVGADLGWETRRQTLRENSFKPQNTHGSDYVCLA